MKSIPAVIVNGRNEPAEPMANFPGVVLWQFEDGAYVGYEHGDALPDRTPTLLQRRTARWECIKAVRERLSDNGGYKVPVGGVDKWFHSDIKSKLQQIALKDMGAGVPPVPWKTMDGSFVPMSQALAASVFQAAAVQDMAIFAAAEAHRAAMEAAADPDTYDYSAGWPATYGG